MTQQTEQLVQMREHAQDATILLKTLANEMRLSILCLLCESEMSVGEINEQLDLSQSALSQHLAVLRKNGIVATRRNSQVIYYRLADEAAMRVIGALHDIYCAR